MINTGLDGLFSSSEEERLKFESIQISNRKFLSAFNRVSDKLTVEQAERIQEIAKNPEVTFMQTKMIYKTKIFNRVERQVFAVDLE